MKTSNGYTYHWEGEPHGSTLIVEDVPIFAVCHRTPRIGPDEGGPEFDGNFDEKWVVAAARSVMARQKSDQYFPPMHIKHHEDRLAGDPAESAGFFEVTGTKKFKFEGSMRMGIFANLHVTAPHAQEQVLRTRLPFRSVEILNVDAPPTIDSLALLDTEVPFLKLPILRLGQTAGEAEVVESFADQGPVVACFSSGTRAAFLFEDHGVDSMTKKQSQQGVLFKDKYEDEDEGAATGDNEESKVSFGDEEEPEDSGGDEDSGDDMGSLWDEPEPEVEDDSLGSLEDFLHKVVQGEILVKDFEALKRAIDQYTASVAQQQPVGPQPQAPQPQQQQPKPVAPAAVPGGEAMTASKKAGPLVTRLLDEIAELKTANIAMRRDIGSMKQSTVRDRDIADAMERLKDRPLGADLESDLREHHEKWGREAFKTFVDRIAKYQGVAPDSSDKAKAQEASEVAMRFAEGGKTAVQKATDFERQWGWLKRQNPKFSPTCEEFVTMMMEDWAADRAG